MVEFSDFNLLVFGMASSLVLLAFVLLSGRQTRLDDRLAGLSGKTDEKRGGQTVKDFARAALPRFGSPLVPQEDAERTLLQTRLLRAGLYGRQAMRIFLGVKMLLIVGPALIGVMLGLVGIFPLVPAVMVGILCGVFGLIGPSFWLD